jgi:hypothetical protein
MNDCVSLTNEVGKVWKEVAKVCFEVPAYHLFGCT